MLRKALLLPLLAAPFLTLAALGRPTIAVNDHVRYLHIGVEASEAREFDVAAALSALLSRPPGLPACIEGRACGVPGLVALTQSQPNRAALIQALIDGRLETALVPADRVYAARCHAAVGAPSTALAIIGEVYSETLHVLVRAGSGLSGVAALGGRRVAVGQPGSDDRRLADRILAAHGLRPKDVIRVEVGGDAALLALADGRIDALFRIAVAPDPAIATAIGAGAKLVPVVDERGGLSGLHPFGAPGQIKADLYGNGQDDVATLTQPVVWVAGPALPRDLAGSLAAAFINGANRASLAEAAPDVELLRPAARRISAPLHPEAGRHYEIAPIAIACPARAPR